MIAPTEKVNVDWDGNMFLADDEINVRKGIETGEWLVFEPGKEKIVKYLTSGKIDMASLELPKDVFTGDRIRMEKLGMNDGVYTWWNTLAYYVDKYNLRLPEEFENHILKQTH